MGNRTGERIIHGYDTERRQVLCGLREQTNSTKHAAAVTCTTCRELLGLSPAAGVSEGRGA